MEAHRWFEKAAEADFGPAQLLVGVSFWNGDGVEADPVAALGWAQLAADSNTPKARDAASAMRSEMTPQQILDAGRWVRQRQRASIAAELESVEPIDADRPAD